MPLNNHRYCSASVVAHTLAVVAGSNHPAAVDTPVAVDIPVAGSILVVVGPVGIEVGSPFVDYFDCKKVVLVGRSHLGYGCSRQLRSSLAVDL